MADLSNIVLDDSTQLGNGNNGQGDEQQQQGQGNGQGDNNNGQGNNGQQGQENNGNDQGQGNNGQGEGNNNQGGEPTLLEELEKNYDIKVGEKFEIENEGTFTIDENGNLLNENGEVFKNADEVKAYFESLNSFNDDFNTLAGLKSYLDAEPLGDDNKPIEFSDTPEGRKAYLEAVINGERINAADEAIKNFFDSEPQVANFYNYVKSGGDPKKYMLEEDRSSVEFNADDVESQKEIIRQAWRENNQAGSPEDYIAYLEAGGSLADVAKKTLDALKEKDAERKQQLENERIAKEQARLESYKQAVNAAIAMVDNGEFDGCKIPDNVTLDRNGKKVTYSKQDFKKYLFSPTANGQTQYNIDRENLSDDILTKRYLLDAWITFTGGSYKDIVNMAVKDNEVKKLRLIAKKATQNSGKPVYQSRTNHASATSDIIL